MSYMRGQYYIFCDGKNFYFNEFSLPVYIVDMFVVMRYNELKKKDLKRIEKQAMSLFSGNFGADALRKKHGKPTIIEALQTLKSKTKRRKK